MSERNGRGYGTYESAYDDERYALDVTDRSDPLRCAHGVSMSRQCLLCASEQVGLIPTRTLPKRPA